MARDRNVYRLTWLAGVVLPLVAAFLGALAIREVLPTVALLAGGLGVAAASVAGHLRMRSLIADNRRALAAVRATTTAIAPTAPSPIAVGSAEGTFEELLLDAEERLSRQIFEAMSVVAQAAADTYPGPPSFDLPRAVGVVGSDALVAALPDGLRVVRLVPSRVRADLAAAGADSLIIEERALLDGPWRGAMLPQGAKLFGELRDAMTGTGGQARQVYVIAQSGIPGVAARGLRVGAVVIDDTFRHGSGATPRLLKALIDYRGAHD